MIISILIAIVFTILLIRAIAETIWGSCLIVHGLICHAIALVLYTVAFLLRLCGKIQRKFSKPQPKPVNVRAARAITNHFASIR